MGHGNSPTTGTMRHDRPKRAERQRAGLNSQGAGPSPATLCVGLSLKAWIRRDRAGNPWQVPQPAPVPTEPPTVTEGPGPLSPPFLGRNRTPAGQAGQQGAAPGHQKSPDHPKGTQYPPLPAGTGQNPPQGHLRRSLTGPPTRGSPVRQKAPGLGLCEHQGPGRFAEKSGRPFLTRTRDLPLVYHGGIRVHAGDGGVVLLLGDEAVGRLACWFSTRNSSRSESESPGGQKRVMASWMGERGISLWEVYSPAVPSWKTPWVTPVM